MDTHSSNASIAIPLLQRAFGATYEDMQKMEETLSRSEAAWTVLRPPRLRDRAPTGRLAVAQVSDSGRAKHYDRRPRNALLDAVEEGRGGLGVRYVATASGKERSTK